MRGNLQLVAGAGEGNWRESWPWRSQGSHELSLSNKTPENHSTPSIRNSSRHAKGWTIRPMPHSGRRMARTCSRD